MVVVEDAVYNLGVFKIASGILSIDIVTDDTVAEHVMVIKLYYSYLSRIRLIHAGNYETVHIIVLNSLYHPITGKEFLFSFQDGLLGLVSLGKSDFITFEAAIDINELLGHHFIQLEFSLTYPKFLRCEMTALVHSLDDVTICPVP